MHARARVFLSGAVAGAGVALLGWVVLASPAVVLGGVLVAVLSAAAFVLDARPPYAWGNRRTIRTALASLSDEEYQVLLACASLGEVPPTARVGALSTLQRHALVVLARDGEGGRPRADVPRDVRRELAR